MSNDTSNNSSAENRLKKLKTEVKNLLQTQTDYNKERERISETVRRLNKEELENLKRNNPYMYEIFQIQKSKEELSAYIGNYKDAKEKVLAIEKWYNQEYEKIKANKQNLSANEQMEAFSSLELLKKSQLQSAKNEVWEERGQKMGEIFSDDLSKILLQYESFEDGMKNVTKRLYEYIIKESTNALLQQIFGIQVMENMKNKLSAVTLFGKKWSGGGSFLSGIFKGIGGKHHSGGIIPVGANAELPGTEEQLALLKGGERILSPSENTEYNSSQGGCAPVVFNNFNIKAWDSKDVQKYLLENKQLLNSITYEGIKNNQSQLRQIVRNA